MTTLYLLDFIGVLYSIFPFACAAVEYLEWQFERMDEMASKLGEEVENLEYGGKVIELVRKDHRFMQYVADLV